MTDRVEILAPAKINLALHVTGRRDDGYHLLETLVVFADMGDRISVCLASEDRFTVTGAFGAGVPLDGGNLILKARDRLRDISPAARRPLHIALDKRLPVASGLGGGSSDAAATMRGMVELLGLGLAMEQLCSHAGRMGADLPMCLVAKPLVATGTGERLSVLDRFPLLPLVLVNPGITLATPRVFEALQQKTNPGLPPLAREPSPGLLVDWLAGTRNDLQPPAIAIAPAITQVLQALADEEALLARMSGSGASCFGIFATIGQARQAAASIGRKNPGWFAAACEAGSRDKDHG